MALIHLVESMGDADVLGKLHHGSDYTPYEGLRVKGWPVMTIVRGVPVCEEGRILVEPGIGQELPRALSPFAVPRGLPSVLDG